MESQERAERVVRYPHQLIVMVGPETNDRVRALVNPAGSDDVVSIAAVLRRIVALGLPAMEREIRRASTAQPQWRG